MKDALVVVSVVLACCASALDVTTKRLGSIKASESVVTGVSGSSGVTTNDVCAIVTNDVTDVRSYVGSRFATPVIKTLGLEPTDPAITNLAVRWNGEYWEAHIAGWTYVDGALHFTNDWFKCAITNEDTSMPYCVVNSNLLSDATTVWAGNKSETGFGEDIARGLICYANGTQTYTITNATRNALGLAYERDLAGAVSNTVTRGYVEGLGVAGGGTSTNAVSEIITNHVTTGYLATQLSVAEVEAQYSTLSTSVSMLSYQVSSLTSDVATRTTTNDVRAIVPAVVTNNVPVYSAWSTGEVYEVSEPYPVHLTHVDTRLAAYPGGAYSWELHMVGTWNGEAFDAWMNTENYNPDATSITASGITTTRTLIGHRNALGLAYRADVTNVEATVSAWETYWKGDRVRLSVTNYYGNTSGELPRLRIEEFDHSVTNGSAITNVYKIVWDEEARHTNYQAQVDAKVSGISNTVMTAAFMQTTAQLANKAPKAWGSVTSAGTKAPENTVWHTAPNTVFAGGTEYAHVAVGEGTICVLTDNGAPVYTEGEEGTFRFKDDSGQYFFGFDIRSAYTLGCRTDGIEVSGGIVSLTYDLTSADNPEILTCTNLLTGTWSEVEVTWEENPPVAGTKICYINVGSNPQGYYKAQMSYAGGAKFLTNMQADLAGGIAASNETLNVIQNVYPVITSTGVVWRVKN